jgi:hypothetical protein
VDYTQLGSATLTLDNIENSLCRRRCFKRRGTREREDNRTFLPRRAGGRQRPPFKRRKTKVPATKKVVPLSEKKKSPCITMGFCNTFCYKLDFLGVSLWAGGAS